MHYNDVFIIGTYVKIYMCVDLSVSQHYEEYEGLYDE